MNLKKIILITILLSFYIALFAQDNAQIDSLIIILNKSKEDTSKVKLLNKISKIYYSLNVEKALEYSEKALELSKKINYSEGLKVSLINKADALFYKGLPDESRKIKEHLLEICIKENDSIRIGNINNDIGFIYREQGNYAKALEYFQFGLKIHEKINNLDGMAGSYMYLGVTYSDLEKYKEAVDFLLKAMALFVKTDNKAQVANTNARIGNIYWSEKDYKNAMIYYEKSLEGFSKINHQRGIAVIYNNMGGVCRDMKDFKKAKNYIEKGIKIRTEIGDQNGVSILLNNLGDIMKDLHQLNSALDYYYQSVEIAEKLNYIDHQKELYLKISNIYFDLNNFEKAYHYHFLYSNMKDSVYNKENSKIIAEMTEKYENEKKQKEIELLNKEKQIQQFELTNNQEQIRKQKYIIVFIICFIILISAFSFFMVKLYKQKKHANVLLEIKNQEIEQQKEEIESQRDNLSVLNTELQQQKEEITTQRDEIESQRDFVTVQKTQIEFILNEQTKSINYAKRIQEAILPELSPKSQIPRTKSQVSNSKLQNLQSEKLQSSEMFIENSNQLSDERSQNNNLTIQQFNHLNETTNFKLQTTNIFVLFRPKDIVSGDFYWFSKVNDYLIYAVADCTGHGVPGAFMSMLGVSFLNEIVRKKEITKASEVLDILRNSIIEALQQKGQSGEQKDGMDISLIAIKTQVPNSKFQEPSSKSQIPNFKSQENDEQLNIRTIEQSNQEQQTSNVFNAQWAGANNPLWIVLNTKNLTGFQNLSGLEEVKPDKMPIAIYERMDNFTNHEILLHAGDIIYLMSDGYQDQFGGLKDKKFLSKNLKQLLVANCQLPMEEQKQVLEKTLVDWIGSGEQIDDITILGIKI